MCSISQGHLFGYICRLMQHQPGPSSWLCLSPHALSPPAQCFTRHVLAGHETLLCTFRPLPLPYKPDRNTACIEVFKTCAKYLRAALPPCQRFAIARSNAPALPGRNTAFRGFQNLREARSTRAPNPSVQL